MKKLFVAVVVALSLTSLSFACGGMTQIDPPSLQLDAGPSNTSIDSAVDQLQGIVVLC
jgi:hypothetical protein